MAAGDGILQRRRSPASCRMAVTAPFARFDGTADACPIIESPLDDGITLGLDSGIFVVYFRLRRRVVSSRDRLGYFDVALAEARDHGVRSLHEVFFGIDGKINRVLDGSDCRTDVFSNVLGRINDGVHDSRIQDAIASLRSNHAHVLVLPVRAKCTGRRVDQMLGGNHVRIDAWGESIVRITHAVGAEPFPDCRFLVSEDDTDLHDATI